ncbi:MAG TPA: exonuclease domain-containing protein [Acidimicrobiales bacterium]|nr:exonuclease domain-containing protein [Acidimicrobiales bacterium]
MTTYVGFDLETTGVSSFRDVPVSYGFVEHVRSAQGVETRSEGGYVNPGVAIPAGASAIHGITNEMVSDAPALTEAAEAIAQRLGSIWATGGVIVGMNVSYDLTMIDSLCHRLATATLEQRGTVGPVLDILILDRHFDKWRKGARKLNDLCLHYGVNLTGAHSAVEDAEASLNVLEEMQRQFPAIGELSVSAINDTSRAWYQEWLTSFSSYLEKRGEGPVNVGRFEWPIHQDR